MCINPCCNVFLLLLLFILLVVCLCCLVYKTYSYTSCKFMKELFCQNLPRGRLLFLLFGCTMQNNMECTRCFGEEMTHVRHNVLACVQHLALVNRLMLLFWAYFLFVYNEICWYILAMWLVIFV